MADQDVSKIYFLIAETSTKGEAALKCRNVQVEGEIFGLGVAKKNLLDKEKFKKFDKENG